MTDKVAEPFFFGTRENSRNVYIMGLILNCKCMIGIFSTKSKRQKSVARVMGQKDIKSLEVVAIECSHLEFCFFLKKNQQNSDINRGNT